MKSHGQALRGGGYSGMMHVWWKRSDLQGLSAIGRSIAQATILPDWRGGYTKGASTCPRALSCLSISVAPSDRLLSATAVDRSDKGSFTATISADFIRPISVFEILTDPVASSVILNILEGKIPFLDSVKSTSTYCARSA